jgi:hypothetical protein
MKLNWLHKFKVTKEQKIKEEEKTTNEKGEEIIVKREVTKNVPITFAMRKPNRRLIEKGELFYGVKLAEGIKAGLLTRPLLAKRYKNDGGPLSDTEKKRYAEVYLNMLKMQDELERIKMNPDNLSEEARIDLATDIVTEIASMKDELTEYELVQTSLFDQTAETKARNQTIMWWVLHLAYEKKGEDDFKSVFGDSENYEDRLTSYDEIEDLGEAFWTEVIKKFAYFVSFWYTNGITEEEHFKEVERRYYRDNGIEDLPEDLKEKKTEEKTPENTQAKEKSAPREEKTEAELAEKTAA